jgi:hypothetical protein
MSITFTCTRMLITAPIMRAIEDEKARGRLFVRFDSAPSYEFHDPIKDDDQHEEQTNILKYMYAGDIGGAISSALRQAGMPRQLCDAGACCDLSRVQHHKKLRTHGASYDRYFNIYNHDIAEAPKTDKHFSCMPRMGSNARVTGALGEMLLRIEALFCIELQHHWSAGAFTGRYIPMVAAYAFDQCDEQPAAGSGYNDFKYPPKRPVLIN